MTNYTFEEIKGLLLKSIQEHDFESELRLCFHDNPNEYMIIIYDDTALFSGAAIQKKQAASTTTNHWMSCITPNRLMGLFWKGTGKKLKSCSVRILTYWAYGTNGGIPYDSRRSLLRVKR